MKIECKIKRKGGSKITFGPSVVYHFKPESGNHDDPHVCEVDNAAHIRRLLSIEPETYIAHVASEDEIQELDAVIANSVDDSHLDNDPTDDDVTNDGDAVDGEEDSLANLSVDDFTDDEEDNDDLSGSVIEPSASEPVKESEEQRLERLTAEHIEVFGKKPHHKASADTIQQKLIEHAQSQQSA